MKKFIAFTLTLILSSCLLFAVSGTFTVACPVEYSSVDNTFGVGGAFGYLLSLPKGEHVTGGFGIHGEILGCPGKGMAASFLTGPNLEFEPSSKIFINVLLGPCYRMQLIHGKEVKGFGLGFSGQGGFELFGASNATYGLLVGTTCSLCPMVWGEAGDGRLFAATLSLGLSIRTDAISMDDVLDMVFGK